MVAVLGLGRFSFRKHGDFVSLYKMHRDFWQERCRLDHEQSQGALLYQRSYDFGLRWRL